MKSVNTSIGLEVGVSINLVRTLAYHQVRLSLPARYKIKVLHLESVAMSFTCYDKGRFGSRPCKIILLHPRRHLQHWVGQGAAPRRAC